MPVPEGYKTAVEGWETYVVGMVLDREALAEWVLREMEEEKWVGKCPAVGNA